MCFGFYFVDLCNWISETHLRSQEFSVLRLVVHGKEGPRVSPVPPFRQWVLLCVAFNSGHVGVCLVSDSDEQEMKFFMFSCRSLAVLLVALVAWWDPAPGGPEV